MATSDDNDWQKLPTDQKVQHKAWKARIAGYEECVKLFPTDQNAELNKYLPLLKKFVIDPNENAREKALDAVFAFVEEGSIAGRTVNEVASGLIAKCFNGRSKLKERAFEIILMYIEIEKQGEIEEELVKGLVNKQPKIVQACLELLRKGLSEFGSKTLPIKPFIKQVIPLLEDRDKTVRDESKLLIVEIYKWIGKQTLMPLIQNVQAIQMQELKVEFDKLDLSGIGRPRQMRFLRSEQELKEKMEERTESSSVVIEDVNLEVQEDLDPFEMLEAVNILERLPKDFFEKIESKQWKDRKEVLDDLFSLLTQNPKPTSECDYSELMKILKKIIAKDSNIPVVLVAAKCLSALAKGLRQAFRIYAVNVIEVCLDRCREKKNNVVEVLRETSEASYSGTNLEQFSEVALTLLAHKTPIVRQCTQQFLTKCFSMANQTTLPKKILKIYLPALIKNTGEADSTVRDSAFESLGMLWKCLGEKHVLPYLTDLDELKMTKIKEYAEKAVVLNPRVEPRSTAPDVKVTVPQPAVKPNKPTEESVQPKPAPVVNKKPVIVAKPPTPTNASRPPKPSVPTIPNVAPRIAPTRLKQTSTIIALANEKIVPSKPRPVTAPPTKRMPLSTTQRLTPIVLPVTTKPRPKPPASTNRRSSFGANISPITSDLERQSTSTGGSTSSLSSTNTQGSIPSARSETPTSSILRSVSNDVISSPNPLNLQSKSRIPVRTIPRPMMKKSST